jgi:ribosomal protein S12 methylthiotransferase accessory factor
MDIEITFPGGKRVNAQVGDFIIPTDQPLYSGGDATAPTPFSLFLASIGTCAGIYVLSFCQQRDIPTDDIRIQQRVVVNPETHMTERVTLDILLPEDFPSRYTNALIKAASLCAVKKHLENPPEFELQAHIGAA